MAGMPHWVVRVIGIAALLTVAAVGAGDALAGGGCDVNTHATDAQGSSVTLKDCGFAPVVLRAPVGARVTWRNEDHIPHGVHGLGWGMPDPMGVLKKSETYEQAFAKPGIYPYMCYIHPGMSGVVVVGEAAATVPITPAGPAAVAISARSISAGATADPGSAQSSAPLAGGLIIGGALAGYGLASLRRSRSSPTA
jgi:plastocyanin